MLKIKWAEQSIIKQIRKPSKNDLRKPKSIGSPGFYIKSFKTKNPETESLKLNSTCNFEIELMEFYCVQIILIN